MHLSNEARRDAEYTPPCLVGTDTTVVRFEQATNCRRVVAFARRGWGGVAMSLVPAAALAEPLRSYGECRMKNST